MSRLSMSYHLHLRRVSSGTRMARSRPALMSLIGLCRDPEVAIHGLVADLAQATEGGTRGWASGSRRAMNPRWPPMSARLLRTFEPELSSNVRESIVEEYRGASDRANSYRVALTVRLVHASLEYAVYPVLVGHFAGSPLSGAEERLDDCLDHRLSRAQVARDYPEAQGEFRHFPGFEEITPPPGAIVVGLGPIGELTESQLSAVVTRSLTRFASEPRDRIRASVMGRSAPQQDFDGQLGLAAVLIGSSRAGGLTVESSIRAIIAGTVAANVRLLQIPSNATGGGTGGRGGPGGAVQRSVVRRALRGHRRVGGPLPRAPRP